MRNGAIAIAALGTAALVSVSPAEPLPGDDGLGAGGAIKGDEAPFMVAFTFDDGPSEHTPRVLAALSKHDVPATFFIVGTSLTGRRARRRREILADIIRLGHDVGNHTFSHKQIAYVTDTEREQEIDAGARVIAEVTGRWPTMVRPPYGIRSHPLDRALEDRGMTQLLWNIDPQDWDTWSIKDLRKKVVEQVLSSRGGIIILHDTKPQTTVALDGILTDLEAANCDRLATGRPPVLPVSLHYFMRDGNEPRPVPRHVAKRTARYLHGLRTRCGLPVSRPPVSGQD